MFRCNGVAQAVCTLWCLLCVLLLAVGTVASHRAFNRLIPPIIDMPDNLREGLNTVLNFDALKANAAQVKTLSGQAEEEDAPSFLQQALGKCQITDPAVGCTLEPPLSPVTHDVSEEVGGISAAFTDVLDEIHKVTTDKYLGVEDFDSTAQRLGVMKEELDQLKGTNGSVPCAAIVEGFCPIWENGGEITGSTDEVEEAITKITENDAVKSFERYSQSLEGLHLIPYIGWIGVIFYMCFFCSETVLTLCRGGSCAACVACTCHSLFFVIFFIITVAIAGATVAGSVLANDYAVEEPFKGKPTVAELVDHIEEEFPDFYDLVLKDLIGGLERTRDAFVINAAACVMLTFHTISCCCGIYKDAGNFTNSI